MGHHLTRILTPVKKCKDSALSHVVGEQRLIRRNKNGFTNPSSKSRADHSSETQYSKLACTVSQQHQHGIASLDFETETKSTNAGARPPPS